MHLLEPVCDVSTKVGTIGQLLQSLRSYVAIGEWLKILQRVEICIFPHRKAKSSIHDITVFGASVHGQTERVLYATDVISLALHRWKIYHLWWNAESALKRSLCCLILCNSRAPFWQLRLRLCNWYCENKVQIYSFLFVIPMITADRRRFDLRVDCDPVSWRHVTLHWLKPMDCVSRISCDTFDSCMPEKSYYKSTVSRWP